MKRWHHLCCLLLITQALIAGPTTIRLHVEGAPKGTEVRISAYAEPIEWTVEVLDRATLDDSFNATLELEIRDPRTCWINVGDHRIPIYIIPSTSIVLQGPWEEFADQVQFDGDNRAGNTFLALNNRTVHNELMGLTKNTLDAAPFIHFVDSLCAVSRQQYLEADTTKMPAIFREWARRIMAWDRIRALGSYQYVYHADRDAYVQRSLPDEFLREIVSMDVADTSFAEDFGKFTAIRVYLQAKMPPDRRDAREYQRSILENLSGPDRDIQLSQAMIGSAIPNAMDDDRYESVMSEYRRNCSNPGYRAIVERAYAAARALRPGSPAPVIKAIDQKGSLHELTELRGAVTYVVIWTPKCPMCMDQIQSATKIRNTTTTRTVNIVCINVYGSKEDWAATELELNDVEHDWYADAELSKEIDRVFGKRGQFRSLILDPEGKIIEVNSLAYRLHDLLK